MFLTSREVQSQLRHKPSLVRGSGRASPLWSCGSSAWGGWPSVRAGGPSRWVDGRMDRSPGQPKGVLPKQDCPCLASPCCLSFQNKACNVHCVLVSSTDGLVVWQGSEGPMVASSRAAAGGAPRTPPTQDPGSQGLSEPPSGSQPRRSWCQVLKTRGRAAWPQAWGRTVPVEPRSCRQSQAPESSQWALSGGGTTVCVDLWARGPAAETGRATVPSGSKSRLHLLP